MHIEETARVKESLKELLIKHKEDLDVLLAKDKKFNIEIPVSEKEMMYVGIAPSAIHPAVSAMHSQVIELIYTKDVRSDYDRAEQICKLVYQAKGIDYKSLSLLYYTEAMLYIYELIRLYHPQYLRELMLLMIQEGQQYTRFEIMVKLAQKAFKEV